MILLGYDTALNYWRTCASISDPVIHAGFLGSYRERHRATNALTCRFAKKKEWEQCLAYLAEARNSHVVILNKQYRSNDRVNKVHEFASLPKSSCIEANMHFREANIYASTPEFCFLQMAEKLSIDELIALGFELCGTYARSEEETLYNAFPLTSREKLVSFVDRCAGFRGVKKARRALQYVIDGSASPMETALAMMLSLPYSLGGFGIEQPVLNYHIDLSAYLKKVTTGTYYVCDLYWENARLAVEYDSDFAHSGVNKTAKDAMRRSVLTTHGVSVLSVTRPQVMNSQAFYELAHLVGKQTGKRLQYDVKVFRKAHWRLRDKLLRS